MNITKNDMFNGSLIASIAHAIMTNLYPILSYEQSWDGLNYSMYDASGLRGTITFESDYCVGAIRNEKFNSIIRGEHVQKYMSDFPAKIVQKANEETLQYLLLDNDGIVEPCVTSIFWADDVAVHFDKNCINVIKRDFVLFERIILPPKQAVEEWTKYYDMPPNAIELLNTLYQIKVHDFTSEIVLNKKQKQQIPGSFVNSECVESLKELNIFL